LGQDITRRRKPIVGRSAEVSHENHKPNRRTRRGDPTGLNSFTPVPSLLVTNWHLTQKGTTFGNRTGDRDLPCKLCGAPCQPGHYFTHLRMSHPERFLAHQRNAVRKLNEKHPTLHKEVMARILKKNPNHQKEAFAKLLEKNPNHQSEAGRIGGKMGGAKGGKITGPRTIHYALEWKNKHPDESKKILRKFQEAGKKWMREHPEEVYEIRRKGRMAVIKLTALGIIKRNFAFRGKFLWHDEGARRHFHRSLAEMNRCNELYELIGPEYLHPNLYFKGIELDWVVSKNSKSFAKDNPSTWDEIIEYHPVIRTWKGEASKQAYQEGRIEQIRGRGITCGVRFI